MDRLLIVGLERPESSEIVARTGLPAVVHVTLPRVKLVRGVLHAERAGAAGAFLPVSRVIFHGIYQDDFDVLTALALWGGPCLPSGRGMMDCRQRVPCLARARAVSRFGNLPRSWADRGTVLDVGDVPTVAKWGDWHCGEDKDRFTGRRPCDVPTVAEDFVPGTAVRIMAVGDRAWQIRLGGDGWKKSVHGDDAAFMPVDADLLADTRALQRHFDLAVIGNDYMIGDDGARHLLEVNHIPNVTRFAEVRAAYLDHAAARGRRPGPDCYCSGGNGRRACLSAASASAIGRARAGPMVWLAFRCSRQVAPAVRERLPSPLRFTGDGSERCRDASATAGRDSGARGWPPDECRRWPADNGGGGGGPALHGKMVTSRILGPPDTAGRIWAARCNRVGRPSTEGGTGDPAARSARPLRRSPRLSRRPT